MAKKQAVPRVGILVECGRDGLEIHLCRKICLLLREEHEAVFEEELIPLDNKARLLEECVSVVENLLAQGFDRVIELKLIHLVCIERAFESWLLYDEGLLSAVLSRLPAHPVKAKPPANPDRINNAKGVMFRLFRQHGHVYNDVARARRLADKLETLKKLKRCKTFQRFAQRVTANGF